MYTLHYLPDACSLATQVILRELNQPVRLVERQDMADFSVLNPVGAVPVLIDGERVLREGAAIILYLLDKHDNALMPTEPEAKSRAIENLLFANATMHPAYGRLFFNADHLADGPEKTKAFAAAANAINHLWDVVEQKLEQQDFLGGDKVSAADILLAVYARWGEFFPVDIRIGEKTTRMLNSVMQLESFRLSLEAEKAGSAAA
ncbi:glutathione S-transferase family protein [Amphritea sp. HPY]|uniref:glutathione S-transferase family protein n=1 Tax=Amphritea sp. HPY TaxID=3421652 RepID=UPI003D7E54B0